jgi:hypothetical protein
VGQFGDDPSIFVAENLAWLRSLAVVLASDEGAGRGGAPALAVTSDVAGTYVFESVPAGTYALNAWGSDLLSLDLNTIEVDIEAEPIQADVVVSETARLSGMVRENGEPVVGARVTAGESFASTTQEDGSFTLRGVRLGRSQIRVEGFEIVGEDFIVVERSRPGDVQLSVRRVVVPGQR